MDYSVGKINTVELERYLKIVDNDFKHPISTKTNIETFAKKLSTLGECYSVYNINNEPIALIGFYANNLTDRVAYLSILSVQKEYQSHGLAQILVNKMIHRCKELHFHQINVSTENPIAEKLYKKNGFQSDGYQGLLLRLEAK